MPLLSPQPEGGTGVTFVRAIGVVRQFTANTGNRFLRQIEVLWKSPEIKASGHYHPTLLRRQ